MPLAAPVMKMVCRVMVFPLLNLDHHYANTFWVGYQVTCAQRALAVRDANGYFIRDKALNCDLFELGVKPLRLMAGTRIPDCFVYCAQWMVAATAA